MQIRHGMISLNRKVCGLVVWCLSEQERGPAGSEERATSSQAGSKESDRVLWSCISNTWHCISKHIRFTLLATERGRAYAHTCSVVHIHAASTYNRAFCRSWISTIALSTFIAVKYTQLTQPRVKSAIQTCTRCVTLIYCRESSQSKWCKRRFSAGLCCPYIHKLLIRQHLS
jgi:hypothetical protein